MSFPRAFIDSELEFIKWLLPDDSKKYSEILSMITSGQILGEGRWGSGDLMIGTGNSTIDLTLGMPPVVAYGECSIGGKTLSISIHEPNIDEQIEVQFSGIFPLADDLIVDSGWTYSYWRPGMPCPATGTIVREIPLRTKDKQLFTLVFSPAKRSIWLYHFESNFNELLSITGLMDELLRTHNIRDLDKVTNPAVVFNMLNEFSDNDIRRALSEYNQIALHKFDLDGIIIEENKERPSLLKRLLKK